MRYTAKESGATLLFRFFVGWHISRYAVKDRTNIIRRVSIRLASRPRDHVILFFCYQTNKSQANVYF